MFSNLLDTRSEYCNTYCFSTATVGERTRLNVTLYVHRQNEGRQSRRQPA